MNILAKIPDQKPKLIEKKTRHIVHFDLEEKLFYWLQDHARAKGMKSRSELIRRILILTYEMSQKIKPGFEEWFCMEFNNDEPEIFQRYLRRYKDD